MSCVPWSTCHLQIFPRAAGYSFRQASPRETKQLMPTPRGRSPPPSRGGGLAAAQRAGQQCCKTHSVAATFAPGEEGSQQMIHFIFSTVFQFFPTPPSWTKLASHRWSSAQMSYTALLGNFENNSILDDQVMDQIGIASMVVSPNVIHCSLGNFENNFIGFPGISGHLFLAAASILVQTASNDGSDSASECRRLCVRICSMTDVQRSWESNCFEILLRLCPSAITLSAWWCKFGMAFFIPENAASSICWTVNLLPGVSMGLRIEQAILDTQPCSSASQVINEDLDLYMPFKWLLIRTTRNGNHDLVFSNPFAGIS